ncbi:hypothetical protein ABXJ76_07600 [Methylobacter sp. G7]|uniref:hypothetical protein n=1 Tax=Methylobacter sp. G7 TaxID=3230117 RepID=UPI003D8080B6
MNYPDLKEGASSFNRAMLGIMRSLKSPRLAVPDIPSGRLNYQHGKNRTRMQNKNQKHSYIPHLKEGVLRTKWIIGALMKKTNKHHRRQREEEQRKTAVIVFLGLIIMAGLAMIINGPG